MKTLDYWAVIQKWLWLILVGVLVAGGVSYWISSSMQPVYRATATLSTRQFAVTSYYLERYPIEFGQPATAWGELVKTRPVMEAIISKFALPYTPEELAARIDVDTEENSPIIRLSAEHTNPYWAQWIANTTAQIFIEHYQQVLMDDAASATDLVLERTNEINMKEVLTPRDEVALAVLGVLRGEWIKEYYRAMITSGIAMQELAGLPSSPVRPKTTQNVIIASILGLVVTTGATLVVGSLRREVETAEDIASLTGLPVLGTIVRFRMREKEQGQLITEAQPRSSVAEAYRVIRTNLQFVTLDKPAQVLMVTSPGHKEGKTSVLVNLAVIIAQTGKQVIVVDGDLRHPHIHKSFELPNDLGFTNLLLAEQPDVRAFLQSTKVKGVRALTRGPYAPNPAELLSSPRINFLVEKLRKEADVILFDSTPLLAVADGTILAPKVDGVILVVEAGRTRPEALTEAKEVLSRGNANILGAILNRMKVPKWGSYYYHYRYRYPYYADEEGKEEGKRRSGGSPTS